MSHRWRSGWRKLFVREEGSFAQLPLYTRAFAAELLKIVDDRGRIDCLGKDPVAAIAWRLGATRGDRRLIKRDVGLLLKDGYLTRDKDTGDLVIRNFVKAHPHLEQEAAATPGPVTFDITHEPDAPSVEVEPPAPTVPAGNDHQLGLFSWPSAVVPRTGDDATTTAPRKEAQVVVITTPRRSDVEETRTQREQTPQVDEVDRGSLSRIAGDLAQQHEQLRAQVARDLGLQHVELPIADLFARIDYLVRHGWKSETLLLAFEAFAAEARDKRTLAWFNGVDNLVVAQLRRAISRMPAKRAPRADRSALVVDLSNEPPPVPIGPALDDAELIKKMVGQGMPESVAIAYVRGAR